MLSLSEIFVYPVKSTKGLILEQSPVFQHGLLHDRRWAVIDGSNTILTAREYPKLLGIRTAILPEHLVISIPGSAPFHLPLAPRRKRIVSSLLFGNPVNGIIASDQAGQLLSAYLGVDCRIIFMDETCHRFMNPVHGGQVADQVSYADTAPLLLIAEETLAELNSFIAYPVSIHNFRPNLIIKGGQAGEEESWKSLVIGDVAFEVSEACKRCNFTMIDPETQKTRTDQEPLRTLAKYKRHPRGGVSFGINLIPRSGGTIGKGDTISVSLNR